MYKVVDYIFTNMALSNTAIIKMQKLIRRQSNLSLAFGILTAVYIHHNNANQREQDKKIKKLEEEIAALKYRSAEGE